MTIRHSSWKAPTVIAVGAVSGGGKTTIASQLGTRIPQARVVYFDDYDFAGPHDFVDWVDRGADYDEWDLAPLVKDLQRLLAEPLRYIVLDYPFAYAQGQVKEYIDLAIYVDTPLDVALARRLMRDFKNGPIDDVLRDVKHYAERGRRAYLEAVGTVRPLSDILVDGTLPAETIVDIIVQQLARLPSRAGDKANGGLGPVREGHPRSS